MLLIDRYLLRNFFWIWLICFSSLTGLYVVIDALGNLEEFLAIGEKTQKHFLVVMGDFYLYRSLSFFDRTSGILTLIAAMFTLAGLQRFNELTALLAAGTSKWRIVRPLVFAGAIMAPIATVNREFVMPRDREKLSRTPQELSSGSAKALAQRPDSWSGVIFQGRQLRLDTREIIDPALVMPRNLRDHGGTWRAASAGYEPATSEHPGGYRLKGTTQPRDVATAPSLRLNPETVLIHTPTDAPWLKPDECFVVSELTFEHLVDPAAWKQYASTRELVAGLYNKGMDCGNDVRTTVHMRLLQPLLDVILLLLGLPMVLRGMHRNMFVAVGQCVLVVIGFLVVVLIGQTLGGTYLIPPVVAAWIPLFVFIPLTAFNGQPLWE
ncbi:MAG: LptF/LptG family permease [Pirellulales bacterium]